MLVVSDIDDVFLPKPNDLLVNVAESRASLESLLGRIGDMFQENSIIGSAMGPALQAGFKLMVSTMLSFLCIPRYLISSQAPIGGKIIVLSSTLPSVGPGALKNREDPKILGTAKVCSIYEIGSFSLLKTTHFPRNPTCCKRHRHSIRLLPLNAQELKFQ